MEGYLYDRPEAKRAFRRAAAVSHANGRQVSLTLSDSFCVDRHRSDFRSLVADDVDILFGNEDELMSLYELESFDEAIAAVQRDCHLAVITVGERGCYVITRDSVITVAAEPVAQVLDTTGAGDLFAAGLPDTPRSATGALREACSIAAAEVISHVGPAPSSN